MRINVYQPGTISYDQAYRLQRELRRRVIDGRTAETLLLLEHPPTVTIGRSGNSDNILVSPERLAELGVSLFFTDRGGDVTCHGPGQLVAYPILDLAKRGRDARRYINQLEEVIIRTLDHFSIRGSRDEEHAGIWVGNNEIAAIGINLRRWVSAHGLALNVNTGPRLFSLINPCGFTDRQAVSISQLLSGPVDMKEVTEIFLTHFSDVFEAELEMVNTPIGGAYEDAAPLLV